MTKEEKEEIYRQAMEGRLQDDIVIMEDTNFLPLMNEEYIIKYIYRYMCTRIYEGTI